MSFRTLIPALLLAACTLRPYEFGASATDTGTTGNTTTTGTTTIPGPGPTSTGPVVTTGDDPATTGGTTNSFIIPHDEGPEGLECDQWVQDCPEGQKCMPYSGDGDNSWESLKCVDIVPNPDGLYEPCTAGPIETGEDTCDEGLMCWYLGPQSGMPTCVGMCTGSYDAPGCVDPGAECIIGGDGVITICLPQCDPLLQDCPGDDLCIFNQDRWICVLDASGDEGQAFDPCEYANACDPGLLCIESALAAAECDPMVIGCCVPLCDTSQPNTCPGQGQQCLPWYEQGQAPPPFENVGLCGLPMP